MSVDFPDGTEPKSASFRAKLDGFLEVTASLLSPFAVGAPGVAVQAAAAVAVAMPVPPPAGRQGGRGETALPVKKVEDPAQKSSGIT
ncbi:hypothetical protein RUM43_006220 [Polyplax serrata]|uniref:Uncharacterized protein n=1 Tax=Polyplax serrata TaxID=468196 RepID=A0AAN8PAX7_POLSC